MSGWGLTYQLGSTHLNKDSGKSLAGCCQCPCYSRPWTEILHSLWVKNWILNYKITKHNSLRTSIFVFWSGRLSHFL